MYLVRDEVWFVVFVEVFWGVLLVFLVFGVFDVFIGSIFLFWNIGIEFF